jgi:hypothetical protein
MKNLAVLTLLFTLTLPGQEKPKTTPKPPAKAPAKSAAPKRHPDGRPLGIPYDAVKVGDATWRRVENGKPVIYRATAFGHTVISEEENAKIQRMIDGKPDEDPEIPEGLTVKEVDGKLVFTQNTPFGPYTRVKDKSDLSLAEKKLWEQTRKAAGQSTNSARPEVKN